MFTDVSESLSSYEMSVTIQQSIRHRISEKLESLSKPLFESQIWSILFYSRCLSVELETYVCSSSGSVTSDILSCSFVLYPLYSVSKYTKGIKNENIVSKIGFASIVR